MIAQVRAFVIKGFAALLVIAAVCCNGAVAFAASGPQVTEEKLFLLPDTAHKSFDVVENLSIRNDTDAPADIQVNVPSGAQSVQVNGNAPSSAGAVVDGQTVTLPNLVAAHQGTQLTLSYSLPLDGQQGVQFTLHSFYPVYVAHLYLPEGNAALSAEGLFTTTRSVQIQGTAFRVFTREGIPAGDDWTLSLQMLPTVTSNPTVSGLPVLGEQENGKANTLEALGNLFVILLVLVVGIIGIRSTQWGRRKHGVLSREDALFRAWEQLEWQRDRGGMEPAQYEKRREDLKGRLVALRMSDDRRASGDGEDSSTD